jgi:DNA repair protein RecN (Recombination protein N)
LLREFRVHDFTLADNITVTLGEGFNVITGETGSGKSVLVSAISLLLGQKTTGSVVRAGCERASLEGVFQWRAPDAVRAELEEAGMNIEEDDTLVISREVYESGRSTARINARTAPASLLRRLGECIADLHGQYEHQTLLRKNDHTEFLDALGPEAHGDFCKKVSETHRRLQKLADEKKKLDSSQKQRDDERDLLLFRAGEIDAAVKSEQEFDELARDEKLLAHAAEIARAAGEACELIRRSGGEESAIDMISDALGTLRQLDGIEPRLDEARARIEEAETLLDEAARSLRSMAGETEADPARLKETQDRILEIRTLMKKNGCDSVTGLLEYRERAAARLAELDSRDTSSGALEKEIEKNRSELAVLAAKLTASRKKMAKHIEKQMKSELAALGMKGAAFEVEFRPNLSEDGLPRAAGAETAEFLFSANPGEPARPLAGVASGGELSRVMLAFKSIINKADPVPVLIFDEIDAGIGGVTAKTVGSRLAALGEHHQVIAITHLPQVAAFADTHVAVFKEQRDGRTLMRARIVTGEDRLREISRMLGDAGVRDASVKMARQLIGDARKSGEAAQ